MSKRFSKYVQCQMSKAETLICLTRCSCAWQQRQGKRRNRSDYHVICKNLFSFVSRDLSNLNFNKICNNFLYFWAQLKDFHPKHVRGLKVFTTDKAIRSMFSISCKKSLWSHHNQWIPRKFFLIFHSFTATTYPIYNLWSLAFRRNRTNLRIFNI